MEVGKSLPSWITGWWLSPTPPKNDGVTWDDDIPNMMGKS
jgi:hypothetical protein